jgi:aspartate kinase
MITTSEVSVSVTIDNSENLEQISAELREFADLEEHDRDQNIICIVGNFSADKEGIALKVLDAMKNIPIRMISYGASEHNLSLLIHSKYKAEALNVLNERLFFYEDAMKDIFTAP